MYRLMSFARGAASSAYAGGSAAVSAIKAGESVTALSANISQAIKKQEARESVMPAGGQGAAQHGARATTVLIERFQADASADRRWARNASSSLLLRAGDAHGSVWSDFVISLEILGCVTHTDTLSGRENGREQTLHQRAAGTHAHTHTRYTR